MVALHRRRVNVGSTIASGRGGSEPGLEHPLEGTWLGRRHLRVGQRVNRLGMTLVWCRWVAFDLLALQSRRQWRVTHRVRARRDGARRRQAEVKRRRAPRSLGPSCWISLERADPGSPRRGSSPCALRRAEESRPWCALPRVPHRKSTIASAKGRPSQSRRDRYVIRVQRRSEGPPGDDPSLPTNPA